MSKKMKVLVAMLAAILVLGVAGTAVVMAQEPPPQPETKAAGLLPRVAEILGIPQEDLVNAFRQAQQERRQEALHRFLERAVEEGRITQEEADEFLEWWEQRPDIANRLMLRARIFNAIREKQMQHQGILPGQGGPATPPWLAE